jgi:hypothetical protein
LTHLADGINHAPNFFFFFLPFSWGRRRGWNVQTDETYELKRAGFQSSRYPSTRLFFFFFFFSLRVPFQLCVTTEIKRKKTGAEFKKIKLQRTGQQLIFQTESVRVRHSSDTQSSWGQVGKNKISLFSFFKINRNIILETIVLFLRPRLSPSSHQRVRAPGGFYFVVRSSFATRKTKAAFILLSVEKGST